MLWELFLSFFQVGALSIGGGYAAMPLIRQQVVDLHGWLTMAEFTDVITLSQMTPGPIAINSASFVGMQLCGVAGAVVATAGCVLPSCIIALVLAYVYYRYRNLNAIQGVLRGVRPAVVAMIASAGLSILLLALGVSAGFDFAAIDWRAAGLFVAALAVLRIWKPDPIWVMAGAGVLGAVLYSL